MPNKTLFLTLGSGDMPVRRCTCLELELELEQQTKGVG